MLPPRTVENCALLGSYAARSGFLALEDGTDGKPETSARNFHYSLRYRPEECSSQLLRHRIACGKTTLQVRPVLNEGPFCPQSNIKFFWKTAWDFGEMKQRIATAQDRRMYFCDLTPICTERTAHLSIKLTHCGRVTQICVLTQWNSVHLQVLLSATPQGRMFPEVSHPQALLGSLVSISWKFQVTKIVSEFVINF